MGEMRDSDWSREILLRSDWSGPKGATITTYAFKFLTSKLKIKLQIRKAKRIYSYLHSESDARSKL